MSDQQIMQPDGGRHDVELHASTELERLPGVISAAVWVDAQARLRHARIRILPGVAPSIVANAAGRVMQALAIQFDSRAVIVETLSLPEVEGITMTAPQSGRFLLLQDISIGRAGVQVTCRVQLLRDGAPAAGEARELDTSSGRIRAAAQATLRAAETTVDNLALGLEAATITQLFGRSYAIVSVEAAIGRRLATLSGMAPLDPSRTPEEAVCLATLRAIDRWIGY
jgi:hypothetical protein